MDADLRQNFFACVLGIHLDYRVHFHVVFALIVVFILLSKVHRKSLPESIRPHSLYVCTCACVCMCMHACMLMSMWKPQINFGCLKLLFLYLTIILLETGSHYIALADLELTMLYRPGWPQTH